MRRVLLASVHGGNSHVILLDYLEALQVLAEIYGTQRYPLLLRLGKKSVARVQPIVARALLAEVEDLQPRLGPHRIPGVQFLDTREADLGGMYALKVSGLLTESPDVTMAATEEGVRLVVSTFPPPVGFRSEAGLSSGRYECSFTRVFQSVSGWQGVRTAAMGGSGAPVPVPSPAIPPATRWHWARVAGTPEVVHVLWTATPALDVFRDTVHSLETAFTESLRLKAPLQFHPE